MVRVGFTAVVLSASIACGAPGAIRKAPLGTRAGTPAGTPAGGTLEDSAGPCGTSMAYIEADPPFCIDRYEATLEDWSPYDVPTSGLVASVGPGRVPQGYISEVVAAEACALAGKRLCVVDEWLRACQGPEGRTFPYGDTYDPAACNTTRGSHPVVDLFGADTDWSTEQMNDPRINQQADTVDPGGANADCVTPEGVYDLHGNLHEWIDDPTGTFKGGFYTDAEINGPGCLYTTTAHGVTYHDYSIGFRCCADP